MSWRSGMAIYLRVMAGIFVFVGVIVGFYDLSRINEYNALYGEATEYAFRGLNAILFGVGIGSLFLGLAEIISHLKYMSYYRSYNATVGNGWNATDTNSEQGMRISNAAAAATSSFEKMDSLERNTTSSSDWRCPSCGRVNSASRPVCACGAMRRN